ncbi:MAG TPA: adenosine kinase [Sphingomicrobium sp.]|nr:adenosine kinase [Sphingomicrobium sp.]
MTDRPFDVLAIGNAIVDVIADADDEFLGREGMHKGAMQLIDEAEAIRLYEAMGPGREASGGSAANTVAGLAALGLKTAFVGQVGLDQLGEIFTHDIRSLGVSFEIQASVEVGATARCLILVTPDAQRTMNTFLGAAQMLGPNAVDSKQVAAAKILYLEGYLWDPEAPRQAMMKAMDAARSARTKVAFTLSDSFVVDRHRQQLWRLLEDKKIDILFANEAEIMSLAEHESADAAALAVAAHVPTVVVTCSAQGAFALSGGERTSVPAEPIAHLIDTTGAGDLFAAGFLAGEARSLGVEASLKLGAICAAEVIQHYGARPEADLRQLASEHLA